MKGKLKEDFEKIKGKREPYVKSHICVYITIRYGRKTSVRQFVVSEQVEKDEERGKGRSRRVHYLIRYYMPTKKAEEIEVKLPHSPKH